MSTCETTRDLKDVRLCQNPNDVTAPVENRQAGTPLVHQEGKCGPQGICFSNHIDFREHDSADATRVNTGFRVVVAAGHQIFAGDHPPEILIAVNHQ
nr:hypothetical protein [Paraburkholderia hospita]